MENKFVNSNKLVVFYQSAKKGNLSSIKLKKWITFVGKLNKAKGYDVFSKAIQSILSKFPDWKAKVIGDEKREKIDLKHKNAEILGFLNHEEVLNIFKKTILLLLAQDGKNHSVELVLKHQRMDVLL